MILQGPASAAPRPTASPRHAYSNQPRPSENGSTQERSAAASAPRLAYHGGGGEGRMLAHKAALGSMTAFAAQTLE